MENVMNYQPQRQNLGGPAALFIASYFICAILMGIALLIKTIVVSVGGIFVVLKFFGIVGFLALSLALCFGALFFDKN
jgi:hypothetical protein